jgi:hypothetical protein
MFCRNVKEFQDFFVVSKSNCFVCFFTRNVSRIIHKVVFLVLNFFCLTRSEITLTIYATTTTQIGCENILQTKNAPHETIHKFSFYPF